MTERVGAGASVAGPLAGPPAQAATGQCAPPSPPAATGAAGSISPEAGLREAAVALALAAGSAAYLLAMTPWFFTSRGVQDVGIITNAGLRTLQGQVPYRDFFIFIGPLGPWLVAGWFALLGHGAFSMIALAVLTLVAVVMSTYALARQVLPAAWAAGAAGVTLLVGPVFWLTISHQWLTTLLLLLATLAAVRGVRSGDNLLLAASGVLGTAAAFVHQARGPLVVAAVALALLLTSCRRSVAVVLFASAATASVLLIPLLLAMDPRVLGYGLFGFALSEYPKNNRVSYLALDLLPMGPGLQSPLGLLHSLSAFAILAVAPAGVFLLGVRAWPAAVRRRDPAAAGLATLALCAVAAWLGILYHPSAVHLGYVAPWLLVCSAVVLRAAMAEGAALRARVARLSLAGVAAAGVTALPIPQLSAIAGGQILWADAPTGPVPLGTAAESSLTGSFPQVSAFLQQATRQGDPVFFYPFRSVNYVLLDRTNPTPLDWVHTGENTPGQVEGVVTALLRGEARYIVIEKTQARRLEELVAQPEAASLATRVWETFRTRLPLVVDTPEVEIRGGSAR